MTQKGEKMEKLAKIGNLYVYRRVSTIMQEQNGESLDVQMKKCKGYAAVSYTHLNLPTTPYV